MSRRSGLRFRAVGMFTAASRAWALGVVIALLLGCGIGALWLSPSTPETLSPEQSPEWVPVTPRTFDDRRTAQLSFTRAAMSQLHAPALGTITAFSCTPGTPLQSGSSTLSIDGARILSLATAVPLWRDLSWGDRGDDVSALHEELIRLGYSLGDEERDGGTVGSGTLSAVADLFAKSGDPSFEGAYVPSARILWIPTPSAAPSECLVSPAAIVAQGEELALFPGTISSARIETDGIEAATGARTAEIDGHAIGVGEDGTIDDPEALEVLSASPSVLRAADEGASTVPASTSLVAPIEAQVIPASALVMDVEGRGCVVTPDGARRVTVVGSELGQTFVTFADGSAPASVAFDPNQSSACT